MRQLKFRAWDKFNACFYYSVKYTLSDFFSRMEELADSGNGIEFQEATGLTDKNGVEIYEGDIVKCTPTYLYPQDEGISDIIFSRDYQWCVRMRHSDFPNDDLTNGLPIGWGGWKSLEVIGNIYEHPHLINQPA